MDFHSVEPGSLGIGGTRSKVSNNTRDLFDGERPWHYKVLEAGRREDLAVSLDWRGRNRKSAVEIRQWEAKTSLGAAWGAEDHELAAAPIDLDAETPAVGPWRVRIKDPVNETYHVDWSPDSHFLCFSRGPASKGDPAKGGTFLAACEIVGVYAANWNLCAVSAEREGELDLSKASEADYCMLTTNGFSNKEPAWFLPRR